MKKIFSVLIVLSVLFSLGGCNKYGKLNEDGTAPLSAVVATVDGAEITKGEVEELLNDWLGYYISYMSEDEMKEYRQDALDMLIRQEASRKKAKDLGLFELTEEEVKEINESFEATYNYYVDYFTEEAKAADGENGLSEEEIEAKDYTDTAVEKFKEYLNESKYYTCLKYEGDTIIDKFKGYMTEIYVISEKLSEEFTKDVSITEAQAEEKYNSLLSSQKDTFKSLTEYETAYTTNIESMISNGYINEVITYVPEGLRFVKHILVIFPQETMDKLMNLENTMTYAKDDMDSCKEDVDNAEKEDDKTSAEKAYVEAKTKYTNAKNEYETAFDEAKAKIKDSVDEIYEKVKKGEDFDELIKEYSDDTGMEVEEYKNNGYLIFESTTKFFDVFTKTGMALKNAGDYSEPVYSNAGGHIILYASDVKAGEVPYEDVRDTLYDSVLAQAKSDKFAEILDGWVEESKAVKYENVLLAAKEA